jgi:hypothetical protein
VTVGNGTFLVARNPEPHSTLPYLLRLPLEGGRALKAKERWSATARVYCHPADQWPASVEIIEEVGIRRCERHGRAIDLTLDRAATTAPSSSSPNPFPAAQADAR